MNELKNSDLFIKLHTPDKTDSYLYVRAKAIEAIEDNSGGDNGGSIISTANAGFYVRETPEEVIALMDRATQNASSVLAGQLMDVLGIGGKKPDDPRRARKVID